MIESGKTAGLTLASIGSLVLEAVTEASSLNDLVRITAKRSVYSEEQLAEFGATKTHPVRVIDFLLIGHIEPPMKLAELNNEGVFAGHPPQSICYLPPPRFEPVKRRMSFGFEV